MVFTMPKGILDRLHDGPVLGDGGYLLELEKRGYVQAGPFTPEVVIDHPDALEQLHREFLRAGAEVLQTMTFYASDDKLATVGLDGKVDDINRGAVQIELIQPTDAAPSPYRDEAGALRLGAHHVAWVVDDLDAEVARCAGEGLERTFRAGNAASRVAYFEPEPGVIWELIEGAGMRAMIDAGIAVAAVWDGSNPITEIDLAQPA